MKIKLHFSLIRSDQKKLLILKTNFTEPLYQWVFLFVIYKYLIIFWILGHLFSKTSKTCI